MKKFCVIFLAIFVASAVAQTLDEKRRYSETPARKIDPQMKDISNDEKEAIHEAVRLLSMQHHIDPKERTELLKQLMTGEIDFKEALRKASANGDVNLELDPKYSNKINEISEKLKNRRSMHVEDLQKSREEMRARRKARLDARNEM